MARLRLDAEAPRTAQLSPAVERRLQRAINVQIGLRELRRAEATPLFACVEIDAIFTRILTSLHSIGRRMPRPPRRRSRPRARGRREAHTARSTSSSDPGDSDPESPAPPLGGHDQREHGRRPVTTA
jgi:hypothetical protein